MFYPSFESRNKYSIFSQNKSLFEWKESKTDKSEDLVSIIYTKFGCRAIELCCTYLIDRN